MEFTVSKADLVRELSLSQGVVEKKTTIPILSNVLLEAKDDRVILTATDLELGIRCSCPAKVKKEGAGTIPARKLLDYVRLLPDADVSVKFLENHWASLTCGRSRTRMAGMSRESFPELPQMPEPIAEIPVKTLSSMIARTIVRDLDGGVAVHPEWRAAAAEAGGDDDGGDGRAPAGVCGEHDIGGRASPFARWFRRRRWARLSSWRTKAGRTERRSWRATTIICSSRLATGC